MPSWWNGIGDKVLLWVGAGVAALLVMWRDVGLLKGWKTLADKEIDDIKRRQDAQEQRMAAHDVLLGRIDENVMTIKEQLVKKV